MSEDKQEIARLTAENLQLIKEVEELSKQIVKMDDPIMKCIHCVGPVEYQVTESGGYEVETCDCRAGLIAPNGTEEESNHE